MTLIKIKKKKEAGKKVSVSTQRRKGSYKSQVPIKKLVDSVVVEQSIDHTEIPNQQMSNQEKETENNNTEHSSINFTTTDNTTQIGISIQPKDSKSETPNPAVAPTSCFYWNSVIGTFTTSYGCCGKFFANGPPEVPNDLVFFSKTKRIFQNQMSNEVTRSWEMSNVYYHFNFNWLSFHNKFFSVPFIKVSKYRMIYFPTYVPLKKRF